MEDTTTLLYKSETQVYFTFYPLLNAHIILNQ